MLIQDTPVECAVLSSYSLWLSAVTFLGFSYITVGLYHSTGEDMSVNN